MAQTSYMTEEGLANLKKELDQLIKVERPSISQQIAEARDKGDLSENAEYDAAKEAQGMLEMRIARMEDMVANARIIDESKMDTTKVLLLCTVKIKNLKNLEALYLYQTNLEEDHIDQIQITFPKAIIDFGNYIVPILESDTTVFTIETMDQ